MMEKTIKTNAGYTKKITNISSNKMSGIEIVNPNVKSEIYYQKMTGASGAIADGNYRIVDANQIINDRGLTGSVSCTQMKVVTNNQNINNPAFDFGTNGQTQSYKKQIFISSKTENVAHNNTNGSPRSNVVFKTKTNVRKKIGKIYNSFLYFFL